MKVKGAREGSEREEKSIIQSFSKFFDLHMCVEVDRIGI